MAVFETIGALMTPAIALSFIAITGFMVLKIGLISFKLVIGNISVVKGIENTEFTIKDPKYKLINQEEKEFDFILKILKSQMKKNQYTKNLYEQIEMYFTRIISIKDTINNKINYIKDSIIFKIVSNKNSIQSASINSKNSIISETISIKNTITSKTYNT